MMTGVYGAAVSVTAGDRARPLHPLLGRVMTELAEARPVRWVPEQPPCRLEPHRVAAVLGLFQLGRNLVVDDGGGNGPLIHGTHGAIRMLPEVAVA